MENTFPDSEILLKRITVDPEICHGKPVIRGLRYPVEMSRTTLIFHEQDSVVACNPIIHRMRIALERRITRPHRARRTPSKFSPCAARSSTRAGRIVDRVSASPVEMI